VSGLAAPFRTRTRDVAVTDRAEAAAHAPKLWSVNVPALTLGTRRKLLAHQHQRMLRAKHSRIKNTLAQLVGGNIA
jgi:hypothetical protein